MYSEQESNTENLQTEIVVVGAGGSGFCAAIAALEKGSDVILLERGAHPGGNTKMAREVFGAESPVQKRLNINVTRDDYFRIHMDFTHWSVNPRIVRVFIDKSGDTIRWLEEKGVIFDVPPSRFKRFNFQLPSSSHLIRGDGIELIRLLTEAFKKLGGRLLCATRARELLMDRHTVVGVKATCKRKDFKIEAKNVILATGGYAGNKKLLKKYCPQYSENMQISGYPNMGDGLMMALKAGAATEGLGVLHLESKGFPPGLPEQLWVFAIGRNMLWVNKRGKRFMDEGIDNVFEAANPVLRQPDNVSYNLFDESILRNLEELRLARGGTLAGPLMKMPPGEKATDLDGLLKLAEDKGLVKRSDSWEEIAGWMGAAPDVLKSTVNEYNSCCDKGYDAVFNKDRHYLEALRTPPYYAMKCVMRIHCTTGGIKINHHMEVLDKEDKPIPGLYATGIDAGGWETQTYDQLLTGSGLSFPLNSGRIAGENAAHNMSIKNPTG